MRIFFTICLLLFAKLAFGAVQIVGIEGQVYPIKERNFLEVIAERIDKIDQEAMQTKMQQELEDSIAIFKLKDAVLDLPSSTKDELYRVDLSFTVSAEMANRLSDINGKPIYPANYNLNPLKIMAEQGLYYPFILVVINADNKEELEWFKQDTLNNNNLVKLLITNGYPYTLAEDLNRPIYQLTKHIQDKFRIKSTPSIIFWAKNTDYLSVQTITLKAKDANENKN